MNLCHFSADITTVPVVCSPVNNQASSAISAPATEYHQFLSTPLPQERKIHGSSGCLTTNTHAFCQTKYLNRANSLNSLRKSKIRTSSSPAPSLLPSLPLTPSASSLSTNLSSSSSSLSLHINDSELSVSAAEDGYHNLLQTSSTEFDDFSSAKNDLTTPDRRLPASQIEQVGDLFRLILQMLASRITGHGTK
ncbi:unnamed protein product [Gongylonema pulchrum]|uniref:Uncharacterized protein n=1 Tax=Gongylonema pulchrum TaxID=637853 RepID=A0A3P6SXV7_9BILA|nr:unnamed protein product [Gongylonema pulchrum]